MYTWIVNANGDVQVYEGDLGLHEIQEEKTTNCKYYIQKEYVETFFACIGMPTWSMDFIGYTNVKLSDFLD